MEPKQEAKDVEVMAGPAQIPLAPLPGSYADESALALRVEHENLLALALSDPLKARDYLATRASILESATAIGVKKTHAFDWTLYRDEDGREVAVPRDSGCVVLKQWGGVRIGNYRPKGPDDVPNPLITFEESVDTDTGEVSKITIAEMWGDGFCAITGQIVEGVYYAVRSSDEFVGRGTPQDLKSACRTGLDAKIVRVLLGVRKVPVERLKELGLSYEGMHKGKGYGTSSARRAARVTEEGVEEIRDRLRDDIMRCAGGNKSDARAILKEITSSPKTKDSKGFPGFDAIERMTQSWQVDNAAKKLKDHPSYAPPSDTPPTE